MSAGSLKRKMEGFTRVEVGGVAVALAPPAIGTTLQGTYRIVRPLGEGGCAEVFVAAHTRLSCEVAVKILHPNLVGTAQSLDRFRQEAEITSSLRHPHIVQVLDFNVTEQGIPFLVMELLDGRSLSKGIASGRPCDPRAAVHILDQIAQALQAAHARGIVHRDLKPDNVILLSIDGRDDFVKVIDFGISYARGRAPVINQPLVAGTPEYMAPEQACGLSDEIDHRTDQFSLAAVAYTLLTGHQPFKGADPVAILDQVVNEMPAPPSQLAPELSGRVDAVIARGMAKHPADRYPSIMTFAEALRGAIDDVAVPPDADDGATVSRSAEPGDPTELKTTPFTRRAPRRVMGRRSGSVLLMFATAAMVTWFVPGTQQLIRSAWRGAGTEAARLVRGASPPSSERPSGAESIPVR